MIANNTETSPSPNISESDNQNPQPLQEPQLQVRSNCDISKAVLAGLLTAVAVGGLGILAGEAKCSTQNVPKNDTESSRSRHNKCVDSNSDSIIIGMFAGLIAGFIFELIRRKLRRPPSEQPVEEQEISPTTLGQQRRLPNTTTQISSGQHQAVERQSSQEL